MVIGRPRITAATNTTNGGALSHVRVLDLSRVLAGPWAGQLLGDLGAEVIKVERPGAGDDTRGWGPPYLLDGDGQPTSESAYYLAANRNKRSVAVDIATTEGQAIVRALAATCDIVIDNFKVGGLAAYGLDAASLRADYPRLIHCSITGFGADGPYAKRPGYDLMIQALGGLMSITGVPDGSPGAGPQRVGVAVIDLLTGMYATVGVLAALAYRDRTGEGQQIDLALLDVGVATLANQATNYLVGGVAPVRMGNAHPNVVPYQDFATADGSIILAVGNDGQFARLCGVTGIAPDPRFVTNAGRVANRADLIPLVATAMSQRTTAAWVEVLAAANIPCGPVNTIADVFADPQVIHRRLERRLDHGLGGSAPMVANPINLSASPVSYRAAPPTLGADTAAILGELGMSDAAIADLAARGIV
ncbi:MAG: CaiB/BaiF CoA transferase family protein [Janthinobacterium lividum]